LKFDLEKLRKRTESVHDYISTPSKAKEAFDKRRVEYKLDPAAVKELKKRAKNTRSSSSAPSGARTA
jgi:hypothetical protein